MFVELPTACKRRCNKKKKLAKIDFPDGGSIDHNVQKEKGSSSIKTDDPAVSLDSSEAETTLEDSITFGGFSSHHKSSHHSAGSTKRIVSNVPSIPEDEPSLNASFAEDLTDPSLLRDALQEEVKRVAFSIIEIREYDIIAGDNPAVTRGVPLTIDWTPGPLVICTVDQYEGERRYSRRQVEMIMSMTRRHDVLRKAGYSRYAITECSREAAIARNKRRRTAEQIRMESIHYNMELTYRAIRNATWNRAKKKREREWLKQWRSLTLLQLQAPKAEDKGFYDSGTTKILLGKNNLPLKRTLSPTVNIQAQSQEKAKAPVVKIPGPPSPQRPSVALNSSQGTELTKMMSSLNLSTTSFQNSKSALNLPAPPTPKAEAPKKKSNLKATETKKKKKVPNSIKKKQRLEEQQSVNLWLRLVGENR